MTPHSTTDSTSIFENGKLKPGIYKIQSLKSETYVDIELDARGVCGRPTGDLGEGRGLWEIKSLGAGYTVQYVEPGKPQQFCTPTLGSEYSQIVVTAHPVPWTIKVVDDDKCRGFEYVRIFWGTMDFIWNLTYGSAENGTKVCTAPITEYMSQRTWRLIPVKVEGALSTSQLLSEVLGSGPPSYNGDATGQPSVHTQSERDDFGTVVTEVTTVTTTTRRKYRVEDA